MILVRFQVVLIGFLKDLIRFLMILFRLSTNLNWIGDGFD